ncbi:hypothetical protein SCHPADRAFT_837053, partial [Schizopora paradoxa]
MAVLQSVAERNSLNDMQLLAFGLIANKFLDIYSREENSDGSLISHQSKPLRLFLCGPGGTGKTHVIHSVQEVMRFYGCEHQLRFLAPTGNAAALIDGMTCHKGLGLKITSTGSSLNAVDSGDNYGVLVSIHNRTVLRDEWRNVRVLFIDEVSLL